MSRIINVPKSAGKGEKGEKKGKKKLGLKGKKKDKGVAKKATKTKKASPKTS